MLDATQEFTHTSHGLFAPYREWPIVVGEPQVVPRGLGMTHEQKVMAHPFIVAYVMVVKVKGEFVWHRHDNTDDFFLVLSGRLTIRMRDGDVVLGPGEMYIVPVGVEHQPCADEETELLLIEPTGIPNTGDGSTAAARIEI